MTTYAQTDTRSLTELIALIEQFPEGCDPDFDNGYDELEREFAERRLTLGNN